MRMTRKRRHLLKNVRQRDKLLERAAEERYKALAILGTASLTVPVPANASVINVLQEIHEDLQYMQGKADEIVAGDKARDYLAQAVEALNLAEANLEEAEKLCSKTETDLQAARDNQTLMETNLSTARTRSLMAKVEVTKCVNHSVACQQAVADYASVWQEAADSLEAIRATYNSEAARADEYTYNETEESSEADDAARAEAIRAEWEKVGFQQNMLSAIEAKFANFSAEGKDNSASETAQREADAYWAYMDNLSAQVDAAEAEFDMANDYYDKLKDDLASALDAEKDAKSELSEAENDLKQAKQDVADAEQDVANAENDKQEAINFRLEAEKEQAAAINDCYEARNQLEHLGEGTAFARGTEFYDWQTDGKTGHQLYQQYSFYHNDKNITAGLTTGYVSSNTGKANGDMNGWTDTTLDVTHLNKNEKFDVRYGMAINIPTGRSRTYKTAFLPDEQAARITRLGEGWNFSPKIEITKHFNKYDNLTWRSHYTFRGSYYNSMEIWDGTTHPGNIWSNEFEYLHAGKDLQYMLRLGYVKTGESQIDERKYNEGDQLYVKGYLRRWWNPANAFQIYCAYTNSQSGFDYGIDDFGNRHEGVTNGNHRWYYGGGLIHKFDPWQKFNIMLNWMTASSWNISKDGIISPSGRRFSVSAGYTWNFDEKNEISVKAERFVRETDEQPITGWQTMLYFNRSF